jgi:hypothetical protein
MPTQGRTAPASDSADAGQASPRTANDAPESAAVDPSTVEEIGGPSGPEPTRYGDWERKGRCIDF